MNNRLLFAVAVNLSLVATASAVKLSPSGVGEVIIVPYYTVQGGNNTLLSITNVSTDVKAVKVRFLEAQNGKRVQSFNLYLPPNDVWTGNVKVKDDGARVVTPDASCTGPAIPAEGLAFSPTAYVDDGGDTGPGRTREGYVEIIEMGVVTDQDIQDAVTFDQATGKPKDCDLVGDYWAKDGTWDLDPTAGMSALTGGLMAEANIINVNDGVEYSQTLTVLEEFNDSSGSLHYCPGCDLPALNSTSPATSTEPNDTWDKPEDAVSGLLLSESLYAVYTVNPAVDATNEWNVTFPTKRFYTDIDGDKKPFTSSFGKDGACETVGIQYWNRETGTTDESSPLDLCYAANIVRVIGVTGEPNIFQPEWSGVDFMLAGADYPSGWAEIDFVTLAADAETPPIVDDYVDHIMESGGGSIYAGLPAVGFSASRLGNKNVGEGAAYAATAAHRYARSVAHAQTDEACTGESRCIVIPLDVSHSDEYDNHIAPLSRHVYEFTSPAEDSIPEPNKNRGYFFSVVDRGAEVAINLGLSKVKGRTQPGDGESPDCFTGPGTELSRSMRTDDAALCRMEWDTKYYFTIESLDETVIGGYRFTFFVGDF